jgi:hypothetical protein
MARAGIPIDRREVVFTLTSPAGASYAAYEWGGQVRTKARCLFGVLLAHMLRARAHEPSTSHTLPSRRKLIIASCAPAPLASHVFVMHKGPFGDDMYASRS